MNRREMKKIVKRRLGTFLLLYGPTMIGHRTPWRDVPDFFYDLELTLFRGQGTDAEKRRMFDVLLELHEEWRD